jgi:hypothetical protein
MTVVVTGSQRIILGLYVVRQHGLIKAVRYLSGKMNDSTDEIEFEIALNVVELWKCQCLSVFVSNNVKLTNDSANLFIF